MTPDEIKKLNDNELRIKVAELDGWSVKPPYLHIYTRKSNPEDERSPNILPNYPKT